MKKQNAPLSESDITLLSLTNEKDFGIVFPNHSRSFLREIKKRIDSTPQKSKSKGLILRMEELGINEAELLNMLNSSKTPDPSKIKIYLNGGKRFKFGVVSDTHFGSKFEAINELHTFYDICKREGADFMVNAGDITDGSASMHKGFLYELHKLGADDQIDYVLNNYPNSLTTYYICGNHDQSHFKQNGTSIAKGIQGRKDMIYLGDDEADLKINDLTIRLYHGGSGAYAISYPAQKYINAIEGGSKPNILILGHLHSAYYIPYRNIHALGAGCFQYQTNWLRSKGLQPVVGGWIVEVEHDGNSIMSFNSRFVQFYKGK